MSDMAIYRQVNKKRAASGHETCWAPKRLCVDAKAALPVAEIQPIEPDRVTRHGPVAILLVIDRHCIPTGGTRRTGDIQVGGDAIERNRFVEKLIG